MRCDATRCDAMQCNAMQHTTVHNGALQYNTAHYSTLRYDALESNRTEWNNYNGIEDKQAEQNGIDKKRLEWSGTAWKRAERGTVESDLVVHSEIECVFSQLQLACACSKYAQLGTTLWQILEVARSSCHAAALSTRETVCRLTWSTSPDTTT